MAKHVVPSVSRDPTVWIAVTVVAFVVLTSLGTASFAPHTRQDVPGTRTDSGSLSVHSTPASLDPISALGIDPTAVSLSWLESADFCFDNYTLLWGTTSNTMSTLTVITTQATTAFVKEYLTQATTYFFQIVDYAGCFGGSQSSNILEVTTPEIGALTYSMPSASSVNLHWTNTARYGGLLGFSSYTVMESINNASFSPVTAFTSASETSYTQNGLSASTYYKFAVQIADNQSQTPWTGTVGFETASGLAASASVTQTSVDVGQTVTFTCSATGGTPPYSYSWTFGDGATGFGSPVSHSYSSPGLMSATCTVHDSEGNAVPAPPVTVTVSSEPSPTIAGFNPGTFYILVGVLIALVSVAFSVVLILRHRRPRT